MKLQKDFYLYSEFYWLVFWCIQIFLAWGIFQDSRYLTLDLLYVAFLIFQVYTAFFRPRSKFTKTRSIWLIILFLVFWAGLVVFL